MSAHTSTKNVCVDQNLRCSECDLMDSTTRGYQLRVCAGCELAVHEKCYAIAPLTTEEEVQSSGIEKENEDMKSSEWLCDCCRRGVQRQMIKCVYCEKTAGVTAFKVVDADDAAFWSLFAGFQDEKKPTIENEVQFGHVLCIKWDPRRLAAHTIKESKIQAAMMVSKKDLVKKSAEKTVTEGGISEEMEQTDEPFVEKVDEAMPDVKEVLLRNLFPPGECCFCHSSGGVRIQCRRVNCARDFHAMCAHQGSGHVELRTDHFLQFHAYCDRHRDCTEDIGDLLAKLITRPIRLLVGRDDMRRFGTIAKHLLNYVSAAAVMHDLAALIVGYCNKGLRASKNEPPDYNVKHLQVLQFFLSHVPQLEKVYALPSTPIQDLVNDTKLFRRLERTFDPLRYVATYPGPLSQQYTCNVCLDPFHERQHVFYCCREDKSAIPHVQHWRCTKRLSNARERERYLPVTGNTKKKKRKTITIVQNGVRKDIALPKGLSSMTDDIICGVCRAPIDARGLIASCKKAKSLDFEKKESKFVQSGCYINSVGAKGFSYGYNASSRKPARPTDGKSNGSSTVQHAVAQQALGPPKMERINVQRTTRWLACVAQIIRLVGASAPAASAEAIKSPSRSSNLATIGSLNSGAATSAITAASAFNRATDSTGAVETKSSSCTPTPDSSVIEKATREDKDSSEIMSIVGRSLSPATISATTSSTTPLPKSIAKVTPSLVTPAVQGLFNEVIRLVRPYDSYALSKLETAYDMLLHRSGPGVAVLRMFTHEYTRFVYIKHTRAVEKARHEKRKRAEHEAQENREKERNRMSLETERALKNQMLAMRNKQRQHLKASSLK
ncbi:hypothetical protein KXD40_003083 [Peronospora effusa]|uniref:Zinc finger PHD-type domain-containing protein n=1 Tax=Peronospora effusa TaxID=542832 RepID=A0A3M6VG63_9STRA|nr:hypothetical protein DD238_004385 [Peronospora effusa]RQM14787.1 hypothetical protein DD237_004782 [Peronospora effusa]UIZ29264.1 hypothetical protein KXD40_003083 [Peronospora effusa]